MVLFAVGALALYTPALAGERRWRETKKCLAGAMFPKMPGLNRLSSCAVVFAAGRLASLFMDLRTARQGHHQSAQPLCFQLTGASEGLTKPKLTKLPHEERYHPQRPGRYLSTAKQLNRAIP